MAQTTITAWVDAQDKIRFDEFCANVGDQFILRNKIKAVLRENRIPFEIRQDPDPFYSESNMASLRKSAQELRKGKGTNHE